MIVESIARSLGGVTRSGHGWLCRCPAHEDRNPSLSLAKGDNGRLLVHCFAGCDVREVLKAITRRGLLEEAKQIESTFEFSKFARASIKDGRAPLEWSDRADRIWHSSKSIIGTPVETYLRSRGCVNPTSADIRFLPAKTGTKYPTMVARITDVMSAMPISLHFTFLQSDGSDKAPLKRSKVLLKAHRKAGGVIRLTDDTDVTLGLGIGEGIETCLAVMAANWRPIWASVDAGNMASFPVLPGVECLTVFADHDKTGLAAAGVCVDRWREAGREARIVTPDTRGDDWADVVKRGIFYEC